MTKELDGLYALWANFIISKENATFFADDQHTRNLFDSEIALFEKWVRQRAYSYQIKGKPVKYYIRLLQLKCIEFANEIAEQTAGFRLFEMAIQHLLQFLKEAYPADFDLDMVVPESLRTGSIASLEMMIDSIKQHGVLKNSEQKLADQIFAYLDQNDYPAKTFGQLHYFQVFCEVLHQTTLDADSSSSQDALFSFLFYLNFNTPKFVKYCQQTVQQRCDTLVNPEEILVFYAEQVKKARYMAEQSGFAFHHSEISIKHTLIAAYEYEISYFHTLSLLRKNDLLKESGSSAEHPGRLKLDLSVDVISLLFRAFYLPGFMKPKTKNWLYNFISRNYSSKQVEIMAEHSIKNKFNNPEESDVRRVEKILQDTLDQFRKEFENILNVKKTPFS